MTPTTNRPWLCLLHWRAGLAAEPACCAHAFSRDGASRLWFDIRLASRTELERALIAATIYDAEWGRVVLAAHVSTTGRGWFARRAARADETQPFWRVSPARR